MKVNQRAKRSVKRRPWQLLEAPTADQPDSGAKEPLGPKVPDDTTVNFVLDLSMRIGEVQMSSGAGAADVTATIIALTSQSASHPNSSCTSANFLIATTAPPTDEQRSPGAVDTLRPRHTDRRPTWRTPVSRSATAEAPVPMVSWEE